jgi:hypothetical protein
MTRKGREVTGPGSTITALRSLGEEFRRLDQTDGESPTGALGGRVLVAMVVIAAAIAFSFTPPGRAITGKVGDLLGIGDRATLPPRHEPQLTHRAHGLVIGKGRAPDGTPFEIVADRSVFSPPTPGPTPIGHPGRPIGMPHEPVTCVTVDLLSKPPSHTTENCSGRSDEASLRKGVIEAESILDRASPFTERNGARPGPGARYLLTAVASPSIVRVKLTYRNAAGTKVIHTAALGRVTGRIARQIDAPVRLNYIAAFLPDDGLKPRTSARQRPQGPGVMATVRLVGYDRSGRVVAIDNFGQKVTGNNRRQVKTLRELRAVRRNHRPR